MSHQERYSRPCIKNYIYWGKVGTARNHCSRNKNNFVYAFASGCQPRKRKQTVSTARRPAAKANETRRVIRARAGARDICHELHTDHPLCVIHLQVLAYQSRTEPVGGSALLLFRRTRLCGFRQKMSSKRDLIPSKDMSRSVPSQQCDA